MASFNSLSPIRYTACVKLSRIALPLALSLTVTACKTSDSTRRAEDYSRDTRPARPMALNPSPAATPTIKDERPVILCFGDSITAGYNLDAGQSYPDYLQKALDEKGYRYHVVNQGISGDTTKDALARVEDAVALHPAVILVELGGNDGLRGIPIASTRANFDGILAKLTATGAKVILLGITLPPQYGKVYINQFNETYALMATKYNLTLFPFLYKDVYGVHGAIQRDGIHPTDLGSQLIVKNVLPLVEPNLKR